MGEYSKAAVIKYTRKATGMTQEELSEGICEPVTISRYENGLLNPSDEKFVRLMQKMGENGNTCLLPLHCEMADLQKEMEKMMNLLERADWDEVENQKRKMEQEFQLSLDYPENRQYLKRIEVVVNYKKGRISVREAIEQLKDALCETLKIREPEDLPIYRILRETEVMIVYNLATYYEAYGDRKKALRIYHRLDQYFKREDMVNDYKPRYLVYVGYSNILGLSGKYDESIAICKREIEFMREKGILKYLYNFYFNIGWNIGKKIEHGLEKKERIREARCYVWMAYHLCRSYP
ncbi:MAG: helix-turn-helix domain-containing protein [Blautia caecimuris]